MRVRGIFVFALLCGVASAQSNPFPPVWHPGDPPPPDPGLPQRRAPQPPITHQAANAQGIGSPATQVENSGPIGTWSTDQQAGLYQEVGTAGAHRLIMEVKPGATHFDLQFINQGEDQTDLPAAQVAVSFKGGQSFTFPASHRYLVGAHENVYSTSLPDGLVKVWIHDLTALSSASVSFPGSPIPAWPIALDGTTMSVTAMAKAMNDAGIADLPAPWGSDGNTPAQADNSPGPQPLTANLDNNNL